MNRQEYIDKRVTGQQKWYSSNARKNKQYHMRLRVLVIVCAAIIPLLTGLLADKPGVVALPIGMLSVIIVIAEGLQSLFKYQEKWIEYRDTSELLKKELLYYQNQIGAYTKGEEACFPLFVTNIESILSTERAQWRELIRQTQQTEGDKQAVA